MESDDESDNYEVSLNEFPALSNTKHSEWEKELSISESFENFNAIACNLPTINALFNPEAQPVIPHCSIEAHDDVNFNILVIVL